MRATTREIKNTVLIILGIFSAGLGLKGFLLPNHFIDGGVQGFRCFLQITRLEIGSIKNITAAIDDAAFTITHSLADVEGRVIKRRALH